MKRILAIFRKDVRHLWPQALLFWAVLGVVAAIDPIPDNLHSHSLMRQLLLPVLQPLACWLLVVSAIHGEKLIGHEQYWLARPYSWKHLIAAKALFLVVCVNLPLLICQLATLAALGISPLVWLPALLWRQVFFTIFFVLPVAAVAAVTRNLGQVLLAGILLFATFAAGSSISLLILGRSPDWGGLGWVRDCGTALVVAAGTVVALSLQYSRRRTALARATLAGTVVLAMLVMAAPRWGGAFAIQRLVSREPIKDTAVRISFDESRVGRWPRSSPSPSNEPTRVLLEIPMRVDDVPQGAVVGIGRTSMTLRSEHGTWSSGRLNFQELHGLSQGTAWLTVFVDPDFYNASAEAAVDLDGTMDLTLSRHVQTITMGVGRTLVPEIGICLSPVLQCYSPFQQVSFGLALDKPTFPEENRWYVPYAPFPTSAEFQPLDRADPSGLSVDTGEHGIPPLVIARPVAYVQRSFQVRGLRMSQFKLPPQ
jgi:hypothetical protein